MARGTDSLVRTGHREALSVEGRPKSLGLGLGSAIRVRAMGEGRRVPRERSWTRMRMWRRCTIPQWHCRWTTRDVAQCPEEPRGKVRARSTNLHAAHTLYIGTHPYQRRGRTHSCEVHRSPISPSTLRYAVLRDDGRSNRDHGGCMATCGVAQADDIPCA